MPQHHRHSLTPMQQEPSTSSEKRKSVAFRVPSADTLPPVETHKRLPFLGRAFFTTVTPGLASFAQVNDDVQHVEEKDEKLQDPDVIAMVTDF